MASDPGDEIASMKRDKSNYPFRKISRPWQVLLLTLYLVTAGSWVAYVFVNDEYDARPTSYRTTIEFGPLTPEERELEREAAEYDDRRAWQHALILVIKVGIGISVLAGVQLFAVPYWISK